MFNKSVVGRQSSAQAARYRGQMQRAFDLYAVRCGKALTQQTPSAILALCLAIAVSALMSPHNAFGGSPNRQISVEREVLVQQGDSVGAPSAVVPASDGGYVVAGNWGQAWATRVTANGDVIWSYWDYRDYDKNVGLPLVRSAFSSAVMLSDDTTLLCGNKESPNGTKGYLVHLDRAGRSISRQTLSSRGNIQLASSGLGQCLRWGNGFALLGSLSSGATTPLGWLTKLDAHGDIEWDKVGPEFVAINAIETANHELVLYDVEASQLVIRRLSVTGELIARRVMGSPVNMNLKLLRATMPTDDAYVAALDAFGKSLTVIKLDRELHTINSTKADYDVFFDHGCGYVFPDGSLALFGYKNTFGGGARAVIGTVRSNGKLGSTQKFPFSDVSPWIGDAAVIKTPASFVAVREASATDGKRRGIWLMWVSIR